MVELSPKNPPERNPKTSPASLVFWGDISPSLSFRDSPIFDVFFSIICFNKRVRKSLCGVVSRPQSEAYGIRAFQGRLDSLGMHQTELGNSLVF